MGADPFIQPVYPVTVFFPEFLVVLDDSDLIDRKGEEKIGMQMKQSDRILSRHGPDNITRIKRIKEIVQVFS
jgi:hypothetical protein